jgi:3-hydroxyacyl-CoA dehydrogenase
MGSGIAAHLANIGFQVSLLDRTADDARSAFERAKKLRPPHFYLPETAETVSVGGVSDHHDWIAEADWVCEAIIEKPEAKKALYAELDPLLRPDAFITTNTSGLEISLLAEGRSDSFRRRFLGTHFFNPPRYLKLLELIPTGETDPGVVEAVAAFLNGPAARRVVLAKDTPGFIANRYGMWSMFKAIHVAEKLHLTIEQVDEITGPYLGRPRSGSFRLNDLVGLDIMEDIARNIIERCPHDPHLDVLRTPASIAYLKEKGWIGSKAGQGYTRKEGKEFLSFDLTTLAYRNRLEPDLPTIKELGRSSLSVRITEGLKRKDETGEFLREYLVPTLQYAVALKEEISHNVQDFDRVMKWGFGWEAGPFEMIDMLGDGEPWYRSGSVRSYNGGITSLPPEPQFARVQDYPLVDSRETFSIRNLGDGVTALALTTKMGTISPRTVVELTEVLSSGSLTRVVFTSEAKHFSAGFDLRFFLERIEAKDWAGIEKAIHEFQQLGLLFGQIPSVAAVFGYCLGGGLEMAASCSMIAAAPESQIGLPESRVGLVPGGTGTVLMSLRGQSSARGLAEKVVLLTRGVVSENADHARKVGYLRREDAVVYQQDSLFSQAKRLALAAKPVAHPTWSKIAGPVIGMIDQMVESDRASGNASEYDALISHRLIESMVKSSSFEEALAAERRVFIELCQEGLSQARIRHMLETGKPLRN